MATRDFGKWMREEHAKVAELSGKLRRKVAAVPRSGFEIWLGELRREFEHLRAHHSRHMAYEEEGGYLAPVLERRPTLSMEVERLRSEHAQLGRIMTALHATLAELSADDRLLLRDCCSRIGMLLSYIEEHEGRENLIVLSVFTNDIGTKD